MKSLSQRNKDELVEIYTKYGLELPEVINKNELKNRLLQVYGIDNDKLKQMESKKDFSPSQESYDSIAADTVTGDVVVAMTRQNPSFTYKKYKFTQERPYVPMTQEDAEFLISRYPGFHKAIREEIKRYYS